MSARRNLRRYLTRRAQTIFLLVCMTVPLAYVLLDSYEVDFRAFYVAAASSAKHLNPYLDNRAAGEQFTDPTNQLASSRWVYPPSALFFVAPFAKLRYTPARLMFGLLSLGSLAAVLLYLSDEFRVADVWVIAAYGSLPVLACIERGQIDLLVLFLLVLTYACREQFWAGVPLGFAVSVKIFPGALSLWLLLERRYRDALVSLAAISTVGLLAVARYGTNGYLAFWQNLKNLAPGQQASQPVNPVQVPGGIVVNDRWLALTHGFVGSFNNPLVLLGSSGVIVGSASVFLVALWLRAKRVSYEVGFFTMVLASQLINTRLWTMGMVLYLPICMVAIGKTRSIATKCLLLLPLFVPAQIRPLGVSPRFVLALGVAAYAIYRGLDDPAYAVQAEGTV